MGIGAATIVTLIGVAIGVAAIAIYLIIIASKLTKVSFTVGTILIGVRAIAHQTQPVGKVVNGILEDVKAMENALDGLLAPKQLQAGTGAAGSRRSSRRRLSSRI